MRKKRKWRKNKNSVALFLIVLFFVVYGASVLGDYLGGGSGAVRQVTIASGSGTADIARTLQEAGMIRHPFWFRFFSKLGGHDGSYQQGTYTLRAKSGYESFFESLKHAKETKSIKITIPEGFELRQIADRLEEAGLINRKRFFDAVEKGDFDYWFLNNLPKRENRLEGYLFPDTYLFQPGEGEEAIINKMLKRFDEIYTEEFKARAKQLSMTNDEIITLASVIEREAMGDVDRKLVAGVFHNRLENPQYPYLESCATVQYILKERKSVLSVADTQIDSPYNTYRNPGLPAGPIASPGKEAIEAALYPAETDYLFFVLDSSGKHRFAKTFAEHQANMNK